MLNIKLVLKKKSDHLMTLKEPIEKQIKRKKSMCNLVASSKLKNNTQKDHKDTKRAKEQNNLGHSLSKGKITKKHVKTLKNDENVNSLNHKKSVQKFQTMKISKEIKLKAENDQLMFQKKDDKKSHFKTQYTLTKNNSQVKLHTKRQIKKKDQKQDQLKTHTNKTSVKNIQKGISKKQQTIRPNLKKETTKKIKLKKSTSIINLQSHHYKPLKTKSKANRISEIIQKSILYSDVNYDFKQQISFLGSGIKPQQEFFLPFQFPSVHSEQYTSNQVFQRRKLENSAAIVIQKHFRGYIQRKYIQQAKYIIDSIKKIQRFWRSYLAKKHEITGDEAKPIDSVRGQASASLITIKDLNDTCKIEKKYYPIQFEQKSQKNYLEQKAIKNQSKQQMLTSIIKNLLSQDNLDENLKSRLRCVIKMDSLTCEKQQSNTKQPISLNIKISSQPQGIQQLSAIRQSKPLKAISSLQLSNSSRDQSKDFYIRQKISREIDSQRFFNSPMSATNNQYLVSPAMKRLTSPKCSSNSNSKQVRNNYTNYFKSVKSGHAVFSSPKRITQQNMRLMDMSMLDVRQERSGRKEMDNSIKRETDCQVTGKYQNQIQNKLMNNKIIQQQYILKSQQKSFHRIMSREDYLLDFEPIHPVSTNSPIINCKQSQNQLSQVNLLSTQKINQLQTRRTPKPSTVSPFPTYFKFIEEFCMLLVDYLREDDETLDIFMQKLKDLKYFKIQRIFSEWENVEFQAYTDNNQQLQNMLIKQSYDRPVLFTQSEKQMMLEFSKLYSFLIDNGFSENMFFSEQANPQNAFINLIFDCFQQNLYGGFSRYTVLNLYQADLRQKKSEYQFFTYVFADTLSNIQSCAGMICGSFEEDDMTEYQKHQRSIINQQRLNEMLRQVRPFDQGSCEMWIRMLISRQIQNQLINQISDQLTI